MWIELLERIWQRLPRPLRFPLRLGIEQLQRSPLFRFWIARQFENGALRWRLCRHQGPHPPPEYALEMMPIAASYRYELRLFRNQIAGGDLLLFADPVRPAPWLFGIWVHPLFRRAGIGAALTERLLSLASELGYQEVALFVEERNLAAIRLYERCGFRPARLEAPWNRSPQPGRTMLLRFAFSESF